MKYIQAKKGARKEFEAALQKLRGSDADINHEAAEIQVLNDNPQLFTLTIILLKHSSKRLIFARHVFQLTELHRRA